MQTTKIKLLPMLALALLWTVPSFAASKARLNFKTVFHNNTSTVIKAVILYAKSGDIQKDHNVPVGNHHRFKFQQKCNTKHTRKFEVFENQTDTKIGEGQFTMSTGKKKGGLYSDICNFVFFEFNSCTDLDSSDSFTVHCKIFDGVGIKRAGGHIFIDKSD